MLKIIYTMMVGNEANSICGRGHNVYGANMCCHLLGIFVQVVMRH